MVSLSISKLRTSISDIVNRVAYQNERVAIERNGKPACAIISMADLEFLEALEDKFDLAEAHEAIKRNEFKDWEKAKDALGL